MNISEELVSTKQALQIKGRELDNWKATKNKAKEHIRQLELDVMSMSGRMNLLEQLDFEKKAEEAKLAGEKQREKIPMPTLQGRDGKDKIEHPSPAKLKEKGDSK